MRASSETLALAADPLHACEPRHLLLQDLGRRTGPPRGFLLQPLLQNVADVVLRSALAYENRQRFLVYGQRLAKPALQSAGLWLCR